MSTATATLTTQEVADRLVSLCREGKFVEAIEELYSPDVVSLEPEGTPGPARIEGFDQVIAKSIEFGKNMEQVHSMEISDPLVADAFFSVSMDMDIEMTGLGRTRMAEICVYEVKDGKIVSDRFFYRPMPMPGQN